MENNELCEWNLRRDKTFCVIVIIVVESLFVLLGAVLYSCNFHEAEPSRTESLNDICGRIVKKSEFRQLDTTNVKTEAQKIHWKLDSLAMCHKVLQNTLSEIEKQTEIRQSDIRQETNNIINKFNGAISLWLLLLGIICGLAPLAFAYLNHKNDSKYIEQLSKNYKEKVNELETAKKNIETWSNNLGIKNDEMFCKLEKDKKILALMHSFVYAATLTKDARFQQSRYRDSIAERLLRNIIIQSMECINNKKPELDDIDMFYWAMALREGIEMLVPFQNDKMRIRRMRTLSQQLELVLGHLYEGIPLTEESVNNIKSHMSDFCNVYIQ